MTGGDATAPGRPMPETDELAGYLDSVVERALADEPRRTRPRSTEPGSPGSRNLAYRAARRAYHLALRPQMGVNEELRRAVTALQGDQAASRVEIATLRDQVTSLQGEVAGLELGIAQLHAATERVAGALERSGVEVPGASEERLDAMYATFEEEFRGPGDEVARSLELYLPYLAASTVDVRPVVDIGSGRGEWLELLRSHDITAIGVDTNKRFVDEGRAAGLTVELADGLAHLGSAAPGSIGAVTAFHLVEHLELRQLVELLDNALRALRPGGLLIVETPNPTNLAVGAANFYLDPTHRRPVHPEFLSFLARHCGFERIEIKFLHPVDGGAEPTEEARADAPDAPAPGAGAGSPDPLMERVRWALTGPQDYALIARKPAPG